MAVGRLHHFSVRTSDIDRCRDFYRDVLGLSEGARPPFPFPGYWLYSAADPVVHVIGAVPDDQDGLHGYLGERNAGAGCGAVDHIAFMADDLPGFLGNLDRRAIPYTERTVPLMNLRQVFLTDPDGITIEINFPEA